MHSPLTGHRNFDKKNKSNPFRKSFILQHASLQAVSLTKKIHTNFVACFQNCSATEWVLNQAKGTPHLENIKH